MWFWLAGCGSTVLDSVGPIIDFHSHCPTDGTPCDVSFLEEARGGEVTAVVAGLSHYGISQTLGDPVPDEAAGILANNDSVLAVSDSDHVLLLPSLDCLSDTPGSDPDFTAACLEDADRWITLGAVGFKDHAGKTFEGSGLDPGVWVGAYNRFAGWCEIDPNDAAPNTACLTQPTMRFPLSVPAYREVVRGVVEDREKVYLTHAVPFSGAPDPCASTEGERPCHDVAADALVDFAEWAAETLSPEARARIVIAHMGFLDNDEVRLRAVLDAGLTIDIAQTDAVMEAGCSLRNLVAAYPDQVVFGTDLFHGLECTARNYDAWMHALLGPADRTDRFRGTCRGRLRPVGAALDEPEACGIPVPEGAGRAVLYGNAARLLAL